jgi:hypothetical protein
MSKTKSALTGWPADFTLTDALATWAKERGFDAANEFEEFKEWADANGARYADWAAAFRYRLRNKMRYAAERGRPIGFTQPARVNKSVEQAQHENELAEAEARSLTPAQVAANKQRISAMIKSIK